ncbi:hypothetical protein [Streptomyces albipurpureus]|uniref:Uncharacterized protein n=1 Tax=Streptomyces albipurpureus TaxID=2897419 RepID=A0ABT0UII3_9ACTN|nr:hypothetical protein [Streptomyces sp. CWNU-1]MCM2388259.1 hypothetical protein [Streptomyces sp. CWNU-1]
MLVEPNVGSDPTANTHSIGRLFMALSTALRLLAGAAPNGPFALRCSHRPIGTVADCAMHRGLHLATTAAAKGLSSYSSRRS